MSETKVRHFQDWWRAKFGFVPHGDRVVCTLCHKSIVTRTSSVRRHFNTKHGPLIPPSSRSEYIRRCVVAFENMQPKPDLEPARTSVCDEKRSSSPATKICLKWNTYHSNIQAIFPALLTNEQFVDVTLACEGRFMKCHKVILSACSPYFEELLSQNPCQHPIVLMKDLKFWEIRALVEFMYSGEVNVAEEKLPSLLRAAETLQVKGLTSAPVANDSADSEDTPSEKVKGLSSHKSSRRKRKLFEPKTNEPLQNDLPTENKLCKQELCTPQSTSNSNNEANSLQVFDLFDSSNHPPIDLNATLPEQVSLNETDKNLRSIVTEFRSLSTPDDDKDQFSYESSQETDSEQENYVFNMNKRPIADHAMNLRRPSREDPSQMNMMQDHFNDK